MSETPPTIDPPGYSLPVTAAWFLAGGLVTAVFSGSLVRLTSKADLAEVLTIGMVVPTFTWAVQLTASGVILRGARRLLYWGGLGRTCLVGSVALLPAAAVNLFLSDPPRWPSAVNVLASVALMYADLLYRCVRDGISLAWPASWGATITVNMCLFLWSSWHWW